MKPIREELGSDHERLGRLLNELVDTVEGGDRASIPAVWGRFESGILAHFDVEERFILPLLEADHAAEVRGIRQEHDRIRGLMAELGVRADLHTLRKDVVDELVTALRAHAEREDRTLYPLADAAVDEKTHHKLLESLEREARRRLDARSRRAAG